MKHQISTIVVVAALLGLAGVASAGAQAEPEQGVARVSLIHGDSATQRGDSGDWVAATVNAPLVTGDAVSTGENSRTEIQLDYAHFLRLADQTQVKIADLSSNHIQLQVSQGRMDLVILRPSDAEVEIDTPNVAVHPLAEGVYRSQVNSDSESQLIVRRGEAEASTAAGSATVRTDEIITVEGNDNPEYQLVPAPGEDDWDQWNDERNQAILSAQSWQHTNTYYTGAYDLDRYGRWAFVAGYGYVWTPNVDDPNWAPYRAGRWVWEPFWGWTWVSYEPWGWAPYHYGRWFLSGGVWCWWPGPVEAAYRPVYAPAYVSFLGFGFGGKNWSFGFGYGYRQVGWIPVGPSEPYYPWAGEHNTYNTVSVTNVTNITNIENVRVVPALATSQQPAIYNLQTAMNNPRVRQSITTASTEDFVSGRISRQPQPVDVEALRQAHLVQGTVPAVPTRQSLTPANHPANPAAVPARSISDQRFFTKTQPPARPRPFDEQATELRRMVSQPTPPSAPKAGPQPEAAEVQAGRSTPPAPSNEGTRPGWKKFGPSSNRARGGQGQRTSGGQPATSSQVAPATPAKEANPSVSQGQMQDQQRGETRPGAGRQAGTGAGQPTEPVQAAAPGNPQEPGRATGTAKPQEARPAAQPARPGWHRFDEKKPKPEKKAAKPESEKPHRNE